MAFFSLRLLGFSEKIGDFSRCSHGPIDPVPPQA